MICARYVLILLCLVQAFPVLGGEKKTKYNFTTLKKPMVFSLQASAYSHTKPPYAKGTRVGALGSVLKSGASYNSVAVDWSFLPVGSVFRIKGYGPTLFVVDDHLPTVAAKPALEVYLASREKAIKWGTRQVKIEVLRVGDFQASYLALRKQAATVQYCREMAQRIYLRLQSHAHEFGGWVAENTNSVKAEDLPKYLVDREIGSDKFDALFPETRVDGGSEESGEAD